jgi:DNA-directed RNA polymerase specialized sigma24 family protein
LKQPGTFDVIGVACLLIGTVTEQMEGLHWLDQEYRPLVFAFLRKSFPGFTAQALAECYEATIADIATQLAAYSRDPGSSTFDPDKPLLPFLKKVAYGRATDRCRRESTQQKARDVVRAVGDALRGSGGHGETQRLGLIERKEFRSVVREAVASLPPVQRAVWSAFIDYTFEHEVIPSDEELRDYLSRRAGTPWTLAAVKGGKRNGKDALRQYLTAKGYEGVDWCC